LQSIICRINFIMNLLKMKSKFILCFLALFFSVSMFSQVNDASKSLNDGYKNEIRFNLATAIAGLPELNYERFIYDNMGVGLALDISLAKSENMSTRSIILPYYRLYFGQKNSSGFFIEGNMAIIGQNKTNYIYHYDNNGNYSEYETVTHIASFFGFGGAVGVKLLTRNGLVGEVYGGLGRYSRESTTQIYPRVGITFGKRF